MTKSRANATAEAAKGDLRAGSGTNTTTILPVGTDGTTLVANSSAATGLGWSATPSASNPVLNSAMQVWQRGTSFNTTAVVYTADRWSQNTSGSSSYTLSRQLTNDTTNLPFIQYCLRCARNSGATGSSVYINQSVESINSVPFSGKTVTYSFYARAGAGNTQVVIANIYSQTSATEYNVNTGGSWTTPLSQVISLSTTWTRYTITGPIGATSTQIAFGWQLATSASSAIATDYVEITGVQLDIGSVALPFRTYAGTIQQELAACQRYCYQVAGTGSSFATIGTGFTASTTIGGTYSFLPVTMRTQPTISYNNIRFVTAPGTVTSFSTTGVTITTGSTPTTINLAATLTAATANLPAYLDVTNATTSYFQFSAEL